MQGEMEPGQQTTHRIFFLFHGRRMGARPSWFTSWITASSPARFLPKPIAREVSSHIKGTAMDTGMENKYLWTNGSR